MSHKKASLSRKHAYQHESRQMHPLGCSHVGMGGRDSCLQRRSAIGSSFVCPIAMLRNDQGKDGKDGDKGPRELRPQSGCVACVPIRSVIWRYLQLRLLTPTVKLTDLLKARVCVSHPFFDRICFTTITLTAASRARSSVLELTAPLPAYMADLVDPVRLLVTSWYADKQHMEFQLNRIQHHRTTP